MQIQYDRDIKALYIELGSGEVERTVEVTDTIYVDVDSEGHPLGVEFLNPAEFPAFLQQEEGDAEIVSEVREALSVHTPH